MKLKWTERGPFTERRVTNRHIMGTLTIKSKKKDKDKMSKQNMKSKCLSYNILYVKLTSVYPKVHLVADVHKCSI